MIIKTLIIAGITFIMLGCDRASPPSGRISELDESPPNVQPQNPSDTRPSETVEASSKEHDDTYDRQALMDQSLRLAEHDPAGAMSLLQKILLVDPADVQAIFSLAALTATAGDLSAAVDLLTEIPRDHPEAGLPALGQSADWCFQLERYDDAERRYRELIKEVPTAARARRQLAFLLNRKGQRHEASVHIRELCKQGNVRQDELHSLISLTSAMHDEVAIDDPGGDDTGGDDPGIDDTGIDDAGKAQTSPSNQRLYLPISAAGVARHLFSEKRVRDAANELYPLVAEGLAPPSIVAFYGRIVSESQDDEQIQWWLSQVDENTQKHSDYWAAVGTIELGEQRFEPAVRALAEAIRRDSTDLASINRLRQALETLGNKTQADLWRDHWYAVQKTLTLNNQIVASRSADPKMISELAESLIGLNRPLEALLWKSIASGGSKDQLQVLNNERKRLIAADRGFPSAKARLYGSDLLKYPLPKISLHRVASSSRPARQAQRRSVSPPAPAEFENRSGAVGLDHTFMVSSQSTENGFAIYQQLGGGVAVCDYDLDGACDLYFAQGGADPPTYRSRDSNQLFRQLGGSLVDVTQNSGAIETQYTLGLAAGDWNQDGFPDLISANLGIPTLQINNGDGTFTTRPLAKTPNLQRVPSSVAMADVTGDALPDIFLVYYVDDPDIAQKPPRDNEGRIVDQMSPGDFDYATDHLIVNHGNVDSKEGVTEALQMQSEDWRPGLGVVIADFDGNPGNEIFVGNDLYPNQLWGRDQPADRWSDTAPLSGCAYGFAGVATGSMGIAVADFDDSGTIDIHVANFENQNSSLFINQKGAFRDRNIQFGLRSDTQAMVGFGSQAIDFDNDGLRDLVVTNGHLDESIENGSPFRQPCQLFRNLWGDFELADVAEKSGYWKQGHLGRALARLDFNADGRTDFVVTHLGERSALLINETPSEHHWLQVHLIGTKSERDGIGSRVRVLSGKREAVEWLTAGDGYLSRNEPIVSFGLGEATEVEVAVDWPSGQTQVVGAVAVDQRILVIESQDTYFEFPSRGDGD